MIFRHAGRPADRTEFDRLLDAAGAGSPPAGPDPLARLLSAAAAPARPDELAGEEVALAAFRAARAAPAATAPVQARRRRGLTAGAVAWGTGIAVTATAGVAFAAVTIDRPADPVPPPRPNTPTTGSSEPGGSTGTGGTTTGAAPSPAPGGSGATSGTPGGQGGPRTPEQRTEQLRGLCRAYLAKSPAQREKALETDAFANLVAAAGGDPAQVEDFCRGLVPEAEPANPSKPAGSNSPNSATPAEPNPATPAEPDPATPAEPDLVTPAEPGPASDGAQPSRSTRGGSAPSLPPAPPTDG